MTIIFSPLMQFAMLLICHCLPELGGDKFNAQHDGIHHREFSDHLVEWEAVAHTFRHNNKHKILAIMLESSVRCTTPMNKAIWGGG